MRSIVTLGILWSLVLWGQPPTALAQDPPAETYQPGPWQPVARIDPAESVDVLIVNQTLLPLVYGLTDPDALERALPLGETSQLRITSLPAFLTINTEERTALRYTLTVQGNEVRVEVERVNDVVGDRTLNIDDTGAIYIY